MQSEEAHIYLETLNTLIKLLPDYSPNNQFLFFGTMGLGKTNAAGCIQVCQKKLISTRLQPVSKPAWISINQAQINLIWTENCGFYGNRFWIAATKTEIMQLKGH